MQLQLACLPCIKDGLKMLSSQGLQLTAVKNMKRKRDQKKGRADVVPSSSQQACMMMHEDTAALCTWYGLDLL